MIALILFGLGFGHGLRVAVRRQRARPYQPPSRQVDPQPSVEPAVEVRTLMDLPTPERETWNVSAYCPCAKCCGKWAKLGVNAKGQRVTADQQVIRPGQRFIAAPPEIPFGTVIDVPGYGRVEVRDRGGVIKGKRLDCFFPTHQEALVFGRKHVKCTL